MNLRRCRHVEISSFRLFNVANSGLVSYDGAETCELVGCYLLSQLNEIPGVEIGLYRLIVFLYFLKVHSKVQRLIVTVIYDVL